MMIKREMMMSKKLIGYIRVSTEGQAETGLGLEGQRAKIESYCQTYDLDLIDIIIDDGWSAKDLNRQGMQQVIERLEDEDVNGIVIATLDRLTRSMRDLHHLLATIFQSNELHCVSEKVDTSSAAGRLCLNLLMSVAEWERDVISERTRTALAAKKRLNNGESINGTAPYGQQWIEGELVTCREETETLDIMIEMRREGHTYGFIAKVLNTQGRLNRSGLGWTTNNVFSILKANDATQPAIKPETDHSTTAAKSLKAKKTRAGGKSINGRAPYGQKWEDGALIPCPTEQPILETMKHLRDLGQSYQQIADRLTAMGHITRRGGVWRVSTVYTILKKASA